ncbi:dephospho-CoA kinase [Alphaproteobacteria bacterium]|nr:dephospho-CoA kinase [Alphaproteobacteria bacterium]
MIIVGLTGGIASGKTFVASYLKALNIPIHESDNIVRDIYLAPNKDFLNFLNKNGFKKAIKKKKINKKKIREIIFDNSVKRKILESYLHKRVALSRQEFIKKNKKSKIVFIDIPLLFENKLQLVCDYVCTIIAPLKTRENRATKRKGMTKDLFKLIVSTQVNDKTRKSLSNYVVNSNISKLKTYLQVDNLIYDILKKNERSSFRYRNNRAKL